MNQFSLGGYEDVLRVATTTNVWTNNQSKIFNHVYCLKENGAPLDVIGKIEKLAFGERNVGSGDKYVGIERVEKSE